MSTLELWLPGSESINNHKLLHSLLLMALQYPLACYKLLHFLLLMASFPSRNNVFNFKNLNLRCVKVERKEIYHPYIKILIM
jgi:hypothetical protein